MLYVDSYNDTNVNYNKNTLVDLLLDNFEMFSEESAVELNDIAITYKELQEESAKVATYLQKQGYGRGDCIGVLAERKIESIINIVGIIRAGAAYVPVDPIYPEERQKYILENSECKLLLKPDSYNEITDGIKADDFVEPQITEDDTAYVIYTSGSTGRPKGVEIAHGAVTNTVVDINSRYSIGKGDRIIGLSSMCFDLSVYDIFGALGSGATLVMVRDQRDVMEIDRIMKSGITVWNSVPAIMSMYLENTAQDSDQEYWERNQEEEIENFGWEDELKVVILSGDWIPLSLPEKISERFESAKIVSMGGATEASIWSIYYPVDHIEKNWKSIPYGMPLSNQKIYILNYADELCPVGVKGEICIGGKGVAKGYKNDPSKTEAAFIQHPELGRIYKTGDQGVLRPEGYVEFMGRNDEQIKIRGYRVELEEISNCLMAYEGVRSAAVVDWKDETGKQYLCAYVVSENELDIPGMKEYLGKVLPEYMIPSVFMKIDEIPLSSNGKVNKKILPKPAKKGVEGDDRYVAPKNEVQKKLSQIWSELLDIDKVGISDNFFEIGGTSLTLVNMYMKIEKLYPHRIKLIDIFQNATIEKLEKLINSQKSDKKEMRFITIPEKYINPDYLKNDIKELPRYTFEIRITEGYDRVKEMLLSAVIYTVSLYFQINDVCILMSTNDNRISYAYANMNEFEEYMDLLDDITTIFNDEKIVESLSDIQKYLLGNTFVPIVYNMQNSSITLNDLRTVKLGIAYSYIKDSSKLKIEISTDSIFAETVGEELSQILYKTLVLTLQNNR